MSLMDIIKSVAGDSVPSVPPPIQHTEPLKAPSQAAVPLVPSVPPTCSEEVPDWLEWIAERCLLVPEDRRHVATGLLRLHPRMQQRLAERYVEEWRTAADDEPTYHKRDNAGRRAANLIITKLKGDPLHV
ncbi:hypothetical protein [Halomonas sp. AOP43-D1-4]|uniref:hypothetical protein n=1 Tax=Halomonas sp. AOP43-D1-4 TaxID=3457658 RepID=UPI0040342907